MPRFLARERSGDALPLRARRVARQLQCASPARRHVMTFKRFIPHAALAFSVSSLASTLAQAQTGELKPARIEYEFYPSRSVDGAGADGPESARFQAARVSLTLPTAAGKDTLLLPGLRYTLLDVGESGSPSGSSAESVGSLHSMMLSLGVLQPLSSRFSLFAQVGGGIASDLSDEMSSDDWVVSAQALGLWNIDEGFTLGAGVGYDRRTGEVAPLPLVAFSWEPRHDLLVRAVLPQFLSARYRAANPVTLALDASLEGERYHLGEESSGIADAEVAHSVIKAGPSVTLHWTHWFHTRFTGGVVLSRRFEVYVDDREQGELDVGRGPYAGLELWFGPSGWSSDALETAMAKTSGASEGQP
jgi:hypothetical protein